MAELDETEPPVPFELSDGLELYANTAEAITRQSWARVVLLAGASASGKTTLLTSIYEKFFRGPYAGYRFAGSQTLRAWEQRCHPHRIESGLTIPATERTKKTEKQPLLHLRLQSEIGSSESVDLLFTDISGEAFKGAIESEEECKKITLVRRADHFVLFLDGNRLVDSKLRHRAIAEGRVLIKSFVEIGMLSLHSAVMVLFAKADVFRDNPEVDVVLQGIEDDFRKAFEGKVGSIRFQRASAVPLKPAVGLDDLLRRWVLETHIGSNVLKAIPAPGYGREIDRFSAEKFECHMNA